MIDKEAFDAWRGHPVTEWVLKACEEAADNLKQAWVIRAWDAQEIDPVELARLKAAHEAYTSLAAMTFEYFEGSEDEPDARGGSGD